MPDVRDAAFVKAVDEIVQLLELSQGRAFLAVHQLFADE